MGTSGPSEIGRRIYALRRMGELSARELDRLANLSEGHTNLIEAGYVRAITIETAHKLACALGITTDYLIAGKGGRPKREEICRAVEAARGKSAVSR